MSFISRAFSFPFWLKIFQSFLNTCQRFPLTVVSLVVILFISIAEMHRLELLTEQQQRNALLIALGGAFWFVATNLFSERLQWNKAKRYLLALPIFALFSWHITQQNILIQESTVLILAAALAITFAAYITRRSDNASVWYFNYHLIAAICFAFLSAVILCAGLSFILKSIQYLFEIHIGSRFYQDIWLIGMIFLAPLYFLANIPKQFDYPRSECDFPKGVHFILSYILVPLSLVYMVILYAYFAKILIQGELPHGHLSLMISWFGVIGILTHIAIYPLHDRGSSILSWFYKYFYLMLIVPLGLLILAIGVRISQYGFTEQRYLVALCAVWFAILIIFSLLKRQQFQLKHVTISLAILSVLISFGPWGIHQLPINNQFSRLETMLINEKLLTNGNINVNEEPSAEVQKSISSMVLFLVQHHAEDKIRPWFVDKEAFDKVRECDQPEESTRGCTSAEEHIVKLMGLNYIHYWDNIDNNHLSIQLNEQHQYNRTLAVTGYDTVTKISWLSSQQDANPAYIQGDYAFSINDKSHLLITIDGNETITFDLLAITNKFSMKKGTIRVDADQELSQAVNGIEAKLLVDELRVWRQNGELQNTTLSGYLLVKFKPE